MSIKANSYLKILFNQVQYFNLEMPTKDNPGPKNIIVYESRSIIGDQSDRLCKSDNFTIQTAFCESLVVFYFPQIKSYKCHRRYCYMKLTQCPQNFSSPTGYEPGCSPDRCRKASFCKMFFKFYIHYFSSILPATKRFY